MKRKYYVVKNGRTKGLYDSWSVCENKIAGYRGAKFKGYASLSEAIDDAIMEVDEGYGYVINLNDKKEYFKTYQEFVEALYRV